MIFIFPKGRFGNQVFQYMFAKYISEKNERIFTIKMLYFNIIDEEKNKFIILNGKKIYKYLNFGFDIFFSILTKLRIITGIYQNKGDYNGFKGQINGYRIKKGLFKNIKYIDGFFIYKGEHIINKQIKIKDIYLNKAKFFLNNIDNTNQNILIHIRRGDYLEWSVMGKNNLSLPIKFYIKQINYFLTKYKNINFIFLSDDINWCKKEFTYLKNSYFSENDLGTDFALMTLCNGAIISASTLSYLGVYFSENNLEIFAPNYWLGFKDKIWFPEGIQTKKFSYINVD